VVKTIEQILGIAPMNQEDLAAEPMFSAFTDRADFTPFDAQPAKIPLTLGVNVPAKASAGQVRSVLHVPAREIGVYRQWTAWSAHQRFGGGHPDEDQPNPAQLNRLDWYTATGMETSLPGRPQHPAPGQGAGSQSAGDRHRLSPPG
jgi:hypothetical protein